MKALHGMFDVAVFERNDIESIAVFLLWSNICFYICARIERTIWTSYMDRFRSVVVITSASHAEGPGFEPRRNLETRTFFFCIKRIKQVV